MSRHFPNDSAWLRAYADGACVGNPGPMAVGGPVKAVMPSFDRPGSRISHGARVPFPFRTEG